MPRPKKDEQSILDRLAAVGSEGIEWREKTIEKENSEGQSFSEVGKYPFVKDMPAAMKLFGNDTDLLLVAINSFAKNTYLANVRQRVANAAQGVDKNMLKAAKAYAAAFSLPDDPASLKVLAAKLKAQRESLTAAS